MEYFDIVSTFVVSHAAWFAMAVLFTYTGHFTSTRVFTRDRAYDMARTKLAHFVLWYGRESLPVHPIAAGCLLGLLWRRPEGDLLTIPQAMTYFASAGVVGLVCWLIAKAVAKQRGLVIDEPFASSPPVSAIPGSPTDLFGPVLADEDEHTCPRLPLPPRLPTLPPLSDEVQARLMKATKGTSP